MPRSNGRMNAGTSGGRKLAATSALKTRNSPGIKRVITERTISRRWRGVSGWRLRFAVAVDATTAIGFPAFGTELLAFDCGATTVTVHFNLLKINFNPNCICRDEVTVLVTKLAVGLIAPSEYTVALGVYRNWHGSRY